ncbi:MAG: hypothetical protein DMG06_09105 [Acidobacteria bacterium]|nr:MAG: hypothetical protein DMG06_09105 [Acidobacteriota bacterium]
MKVGIRYIGIDAFGSGLTVTNPKPGRHRSSTNNSGRLRLSVTLSFAVLWLGFWPVGTQSSPAFFYAQPVPDSNSRVPDAPPIQKVSSRWRPLAFSEWLSGLICGAGDPSLEATVKLVMVDIDRDGDPDLVAVTSLPRLLVWLNDGRGHFRSWQPHSLCFLRRGLLDSESNEEDAPLLWLEPRQLTTHLIPVASSQINRKSFRMSFQSVSLRSPRAPPLP